MQQTTSHIMMVRPSRFGYNPETAVSNAFQGQDSSLTDQEVQERARHEFDQLVGVLRNAGVQVWIMEDPPEPYTPDAVFPNNWVTFHADGTVVTYPMEAPTRRLERREAFLDTLGETFRMTNRIRLETYEEEGKMLEGTGSLILDRVHRLAYACISPRTNSELLIEFGRQMNFEPVVFTANDPRGQAIYHTNVMMALGEELAVICLESITDDEERQMVETRLARTGKEIVEIDFQQMLSFAGNMLQVRNEEGQTFMAMSEQAFRSLRPEQIDRIEKHTRILYSPIDTIEKHGGGSVRCMLAEIFLPKKG